MALLQLQDFAFIRYNTIFAAWTGQHVLVCHCYWYAIEDA